MSWKPVKLGDIAVFSNGINFDKHLYGPGFKLIGVSNFGNRNTPDYESLGEVVSDAVRDTDCLKNGDIVFVRSNGNKELVGRCMLIKNAPEKLTFSGFCIRARLIDQENFFPEYFNYYFKSRLFRSNISGSAAGTNIQNLNQRILSSHKLRVPPFEGQKRIADVLGAYDQLIENNRKQIKLLEEAAQRLYKEWFVDLRFPGHENVAIHDGLPEGWKRGKLGDIAEFRRGKTITQKDTIEGNVPVVAGGLEPAYYHNKANTACPVITVSGSGANAGFSRLYTTNIWASDCSFADSSMTENLLFAFLSIKVLANEFKQCQRGSAQPHVYPKHVNSLEIIIPDTSCLDSFKQIVEPFFSEIAVLDKGILVAREARDRLLPKLMSGEIEV